MLQHKKITYKEGTENYVPSPYPYFYIYEDYGKYVGFRNLLDISHIPNNNWKEIKPISYDNTILPTYTYRYWCPKGIIQDVFDRTPTTSKTLQIDAKEVHDWREMPTKKKIRQGDTYNFQWHNKSLQFKPLTNTYVRGRVIKNCTMATPNLKNSWDGGLDISLGSTEMYTQWVNAYKELDQESTRRVMRKQHNADIDIDIVERSEIAANSSLIWKPNGEQGIKKNRNNISSKQNTTKRRTIHSKRTTTTTTSTRTTNHRTFRIKSKFIYI